jgi:dethiobiotin synthetase
MAVHNFSVQGCCLTRGSVNLRGSSRLPDMIYFVTAIHTDSGKTLVSAILTQALQADYWKPIQAGLPRDTEAVMKLVSNPRTVFHAEAYLLQTPASPHLAARIDEVDIQLNALRVPETTNPNLVIEGAGGLLVPINEAHFIVDLAERLGAGIVLVSNHYLGSINHTMLTVQELKRRKLPVVGIIFNGEPNEASESIILKHAGYPCLLRIQPHPSITREIVNDYALELRKNLKIA